MGDTTGPDPINTRVLALKQLLQQMCSTGDAISDTSHLERSIASEAAICAGIADVELLAQVAAARLSKILREAEG